MCSRKYHYTITQHYIILIAIVIEPILPRYSGFLAVLQGFGVFSSPYRDNIAYFVNKNETKRIRKKNNSLVFLQQFCK